MAFQLAQLDKTNGYVYEFNSDGTLRAIRFTGVIVDDEGWASIEVMRLQGDDLASLPPADPALDNTPADPRYQAILAWAIQHLLARHAQLAAQHHAPPPPQGPVLEQPRPEAEIAALPVITPSVLSGLGI
jgi:hypothetical protein